MQAKGLTRNVIDKYYTKPEVVLLCQQLVSEHLRIEKSDMIIEPSAGNGAFIKAIQKLCDNWQFYDIQPENDQIIAQNFLELQIKSDKAIHIIGNPPFGRQASTAKKFIKKCCEFATSISFILPKSFKKESMRKAFALDFHLLCEKDLPNSAFLVDGVAHDVPCVFQIWKRQDNLREIIALVEPKGFKFVKKTNHPDVSFRRVGVNAGKLAISVKSKSDQSHYFIKFTNGKTPAENLVLLQKIKFDFNNTVGPKSISKQELIAEFNKFL